MSILKFLCYFRCRRRARQSDVVGVVLSAFMSTSENYEILFGRLTNEVHLNLRRRIEYAFWDAGHQLHSSMGRRRQVQPLGNCPQYQSGFTILSLQPALSDVTYIHDIF